MLIILILPDAKHMQVYFIEAVPQTNLNPPHSSLLRAMRYLCSFLITGPRP